MENDNVGHQFQMPLHGAGQHNTAASWNGGSQSGSFAFVPRSLQSPNAISADEQDQDDWAVQIALYESRQQEAKDSANGDLKKSGADKKKKKAAPAFKFDKPKPFFNLLPRQDDQQNGNAGDLINGNNSTSGSSPPKRTRTLFRLGSNTTMNQAGTAAQPAAQLATQSFGSSAAFSQQGSQLLGSSAASNQQGSQWFGSSAASQPGFQSTTHQLALNLPTVGEGGTPFVCKVSEMSKRLPSTVDGAAVLRSFIASTDLIGDLAVEDGFVEPRFEVNPFAVEGNAVFDRFLKALKEQNSADIADDAPLELVFHGTRPENISNILKNGLDPNRRSGQAYGVGEYFSRRPNISHAYCRGGFKMIVFCVVVPERCRQNEEKQKKISDTTFNHRQNNIPPAYVVVPTASHQVPLGVMSFASLIPSKMEESKKMRMQLKILSDKVQQEELKNKEANAKADIIQQLVRKNIDTAGYRWNKNKAQLSDETQREISMFAHDLYEAEVVHFYFPGIPEPMTASEHHTTDVLNVEKTEKQVKDAKKAYQAAKDKMSKSKQSRRKSK